MPGIVGWLGKRSSRALTADDFSCLIAEEFQSIVQVPAVLNGQLYIIGNGSTPVSQGIYHDESDGSVIAFWGEFYGEMFLPCKTGEEICKILLSWFISDKVKCFNRLDGSYVIFIQHRDQQVIAVDETASRPLYYSEIEGGLYVSPDLKLFGQNFLPKQTINRNALVSFLINGHPLSNATYYSGVNLLRPGQLIELLPRAFRVKKYSEYIPADPNAKDLGESVYQDRLAHTLRQAIKKRAGFLEQSVIPISGGYDSRGILACIREIYSGPLTTVTWGTDEDNPVADGAIGRRAANFFGAEHHFLKRRSDLLVQDIEPMVQRIDAANDDCFIHHHELSIMQAIRKNLDRRILFRGDECLGYAAPAFSVDEALGRINIHQLAQYPDLLDLFRKDIIAEVLKEQTETYRQVIAECPYTKDWTMAKDWFYLEQRLFRCQNFSHYAKLSVLEARNPWLDKELLGFFSVLPVHYRFDKALYRKTLNYMFPELMKSIPIAQRSSLENWGELLCKNQEFKKYAQKQLVENRSYIHEIWDPDAIDRLIENFYSGKSHSSIRTRFIQSSRNCLRDYANPIYIFLKKKVPSQLRINCMPPDVTIGRLLVLKHWCDKWA